MQQFLKLVGQWSPLIQLAAALAAGTAAFFAWRNIRIANKGQKYSRINALLDYRYEAETFNAKKALRKLYDEVNKDHGGDLKGFWAEHRRSRESEDAARSRFIVYFIKIFDLYKAGLIKDKEVKGLVNGSDLALLFHVLKPMEEAIEKDLLELNIDKGTKESDETMEFYKRLYREGQIE